MPQFKPFQYLKFKSPNLDFWCNSKGYYFYLGNNDGKF